jgi:hypothetical protein
VVLLLSATADTFALVALLWYLTVSRAGAGALGLPVLLALAGLGGALSPVTYAGTRVMLPQMVGAGQLVRANGMLAIGDQFPLLVGPAIAGPASGLIGGAAALLMARWSRPCRCMPGTSCTPARPDTARCGRCSG